jgi:replicative DNA helicase
VTKVPHSREAERGLLGAILQEPEVMLRVVDLVRAEDFHDLHHEHTYRLLRLMLAKGVPIDSITVHLHAADYGWTLLGGPVAVAELPDYCPSPKAAVHYATTVRDLAIRRRHLAALDAAREVIVDGELDGMSQRLAALFIDRSRVTSSMSTLPEVVALNERQAEARHEGELKGTACTTGLGELDKMLGGGFRPADMVVVGARPSFGKTALAVGFSLAAMQHGKRVLYMSAEPSTMEWGWRLTSCATAIPLAHVKGDSAHLRTQGDWDAAARWEMDCKDLPTPYAERLPNPTLESIESRARWLALSGGLDMIVVDHFHRLNHQRRGNERMDEAMTRTSNGLKALAIETGAVLVLCVQLKRTDSGFGQKPKTRDGYWWDRVSIPTETDIRECGAIEQDADIILFPIPGAKAGPNRTPLSIDIGNAAVISIAKHRNGPTGQVAVTWDAECACYR